MALTTEQLLTYFNLPQLGRVTAFAIGNYAKENNITLHSDKDLLDYIKLCREKKLARAIAEYNQDAIVNAHIKAKEVVEQSANGGIGVISYYDSDFPKQLKEIKRNNKDVSPLLLYYKGNVKRLLHLNGIAIIGTREPTEEGVKVGEYLGKTFAEKGFNIISGLAIGCDSSAHRGALQGKGLTTVFLAHGLDTIYPKENIGLAQQILDNDGILISEYAIGVPPMANYFVERDRLQSGLANATVVIQTGIKGGTMHAVHSTIENNKPLFAVQYKDTELCKQEKVLGNMKLLNENFARPITASTINDAIDIINESIDRREKFQNSIFDI